MSKKDYVKMSNIRKRCETISNFLDENKRSLPVFTNNAILQGAIAMEVLQIGINLRSLSKGFKKSPYNAI
jgi:uncharacterized protein with HEPN domain